MPLIVKNPSAGDLHIDKLSGYEGGHGGTTPAEALEFLVGFNTANRGQPEQPAPLNANKKFSPQYIRNTNIVNIAIDGPSTLGVNEKANYYITTFDSYTDYTVEATSGTAVLSKNGMWVEFQAPNNPGVSGFTINSRLFEIQITGAAVIKPSVTGPLHGSGVIIAYSDSMDIYNTLSPVQLVSSPFTAEGTAETALSFDWEVYVNKNSHSGNVDFEGTYASSQFLLPDPTNWDLSYSNYKASPTQLFDVPGQIFHTKQSTRGLAAVRVRHNTASHTSEWSDFIIFDFLYQEGSSVGGSVVPVINSVSLSYFNGGSPYPRNLPRVTVFLDSLESNADPFTFNNRAQTEIVISPSSNVDDVSAISMQTMEGDTGALYEITTPDMSGLRHDQAYSIFARFKFDNTGTWSDWSAPESLIIPAYTGTVMEEFLSIYIDTQPDTDVSLGLPSAEFGPPTYNNVSRLGNISVFTVDAIYRTFVPQANHVQTEWQISLEQDFLSPFFTTQTSGVSDRYYKRFTGVVFPETGFEDYQNTEVFVRARYQDNNGIWSNWSPVTTYTHFNF